jgi:hypothetical protein
LTPLTLTERYGRFMGVYFVACNGFIKIGVAGNVVTRARTIWQNCPGHDVVPLGWFREYVDYPTWPYDFERVLHVQFRHLREKGEWFRDDGEIRAFVSRYARPWPCQSRRSS